MWGPMDPGLAEKRRPGTLSWHARPGPPAIALLQLGGMHCAML